ncbi:MAG TPA: SURF1 family protein [Burkholderiaceae bacterium]|jgi:surfeit locus 1 family protein
MAVSSSKKAALLLGVAFFFVLFSALGVWQVQRRAWKQDLIERVEGRVHAVPVTTFASDQEYLHVQLTGTFEPDRSALVQANTVLGPGHWVIAPLRLSDGGFVLINRGFVPLEAKAAPAPTGMQTVTGLLRLSEPGGSLLRHNEPAAGRWFSRDVTALAASMGLQSAAPYFVDQDKHGAEDAWPVGGLTVIRFPNNHLQYAITWFGLALLCAGASVIVWRHR